MNKPYIIGLTGGIAMGKSNISRALRNEGCAIVDADEISRDITKESGIALPKIRQAFGDLVFLEDGTLDRKALSQVVFSNEEALAKLNAITHPLIIEIAKKQIEEHYQNGHKVVVMDAPLLFEAGLDKQCDEVWSAYVPQAIQLQRITKRDDVTRKEAMQRIKAQLSPILRKKQSTHVIDTRCTKEETMANVFRLFKAVCEKLDKENA